MIMHSEDKSCLPGAWYAVQTRSNFEYKVRDCLFSKSFQSFLPTYKKLSQRRDRRKIIEAPFFRGYVFVCTDLSPEAYYKILKSPGVVRMVGVQNHPIPINSGEIDNLRILANSDESKTPHKYLHDGDRVMITEGPFMGLTGIYLHNSSRPDRVVVSIDILQQAVAVEIDGCKLEKMVVPDTHQAGAI